MATNTAVRTARPQAATLTNVRRMSFGKVVGRILFWILVIFIILYTVFPFAFAIISSIMPNNELFTSNTRYWPSAINWSWTASSALAPKVCNDRSTLAA